MSCLTDDLIQAYLDGELSADARAAVEKHLADCEACRDRCTRWQETLVALRVDLTRLDPEVVEVPEWIEVTRRREAERPHRITRITWLQGLVGIGAAAALWFAFFPIRHQPAPTDPGIRALLSELPPVSEDPQRMLREQCLVVTVVDHSSGSVGRYIASATTNRLVYESIKPGHDQIDDSSKLRRGI